MKTKINKKNNIPIVFTFDDNYMVPAAVAIKSLIRSGESDTWYDIYCLYDNLSLENRNRLDKLAEIKWIKIEKKIFKNVPATVEYPVDVYYRLAIHDILPQHDRIIYSDVDVLFRGDLTNTYKMNLDDTYWAGVPLEKNEDVSEDTLLKQKGFSSDFDYMSGHKKFIENKNDLIFASGFMVINAKKMREDNMTEKFLETAKKFKGELKMFDLDILNITCQNNTIKSVPFEYCVLEDIYISNNFRETNLYPYLSKIFSDKELEYAIKNPVIVHYTGANEVRVWDRKEEKQPTPYKIFFQMVLNRMQMA